MAADRIHALDDPFHRFWPARVLVILAAVLISKVTLSVLLDYRDYFPPDFHSDFLLGRESYFWGSYAWAFYAHLMSGPVTLILGMILVSDQFRRKTPTGHRWLGRIQATVILLLLAPSGLWMARYAMTGMVASVGLGLLAIATVLSVAVGWRAAVQRQFARHRRWMWRAFLLLVSTVVIRLIGGLATVLQLDDPWIYTLATWVSWLVPLLVFECTHALLFRNGRGLRWRIS